MQDRLLEMMKQSVAKTARKSNIGVAFSGGVDSALASKICSDMGYGVTLLTVGFPGSHDVLFAGKVNESLHLPHHTLEIDPATFPATSEKVCRTIKTQNLSWNENCIAFYYVSKLAAGLGINTVLTANGIDELFCGYDRYRELFSRGESEILDAMDSKLDNESGMMDAVNQVSSEFGVKILQPFLDPDFIRHAKKIPMSEKIRGPDDLMRKHAIRSLARQVGVPELACAKRKKALQYGSEIHKALLKTRRVFPATKRTDSNHPT